MQVSASKRSRRVRIATSWLGSLFIAGLMSTAVAEVPIPTVTRPASDPNGSASRNYTFFATDLDLAGRGYVEEEFFFSGRANVYTTPSLVGGIGLGPATGTASVVSSNHPYRTRMVVRRPIEPGRFNGTVVVEWINTSGQFDVEALWFRNHEFFMRDGYAWVGISVQDQGISRAPNGLKVWSPLRYSTLDVTHGGTVAGEGLSYDVFAQGMQAVRKNPAVLGYLPVHRVLAAGVSQSAGRLALYLNSVHPLNPVADGAVLIIGGQQIRSDLDIPVIKILSETEFIGPSSANQVCSSAVGPGPCGTSLQPDSEKFRLWSVAGTSHSDWESGIVRNAIVRRDMPNANLYDSCTHPSRSRIQGHYVIGAAISAMRRWVATGFPPAHAPLMTMAATSPVPEEVRDANGNILGGIRLASFDVPVALSTGDNTGPGLCFLNGTQVPFTRTQLDAMYSSHEHFVDAISRAANANIQSGHLLVADANELVNDAAASIVGKRLTCGPLCANVSQFPLNPSTLILRDQTQFYYLASGADLISILDDATLAVAEGYTRTEQGDREGSRDSFSRANARLHEYVDSVRRLAADDRLAPESADLLVDFAYTLIERIAAQAQIEDPLLTPGPDGALRMVEYYRSGTQQFFWGTDVAERASIDAQAKAGGWTRSGKAFVAWIDAAARPEGSVPVCRFYGVAGSGPTSHLFTADAAECGALMADSKWAYEGIAFYAMPSADGNCSDDMVPVVRLAKSGSTVSAARYRFVADAVRAQTMVTFDGWKAEGTAFCVKSD
ncbi:MAG: hypothetical protein IT516_00970 [Burkholderiales bacterium]|nr:hypothetical protein [Burkholderiales bacterium]